MTPADRKRRIEIRQISKRTRRPTKIPTKTLSKTLSKTSSVRRREQEDLKDPNLTNRINLATMIAIALCSLLGIFALIPTLVYINKLPKDPQSFLYYVTAFICWTTVCMCIVIVAETLARKKPK